MELSKEYKALVKEAEQRYPIGTEYIPLSVLGVPRYNPSLVKAQYSPRALGHEGEKKIDVGEGYIYVKGKWASTKDDLRLEKAREFLYDSGGKN